MLNGSKTCSSMKLSYWYLHGYYLHIFRCQAISSWLFLAPYACSSELSLERRLCETHRVDKIRQRGCHQLSEPRVLSWKGLKIVKHFLRINQCNIKKAFLYFLPPLLKVWKTHYCLILSNNANTQINLYPADHYFLYSICYLRYQSYLN